jgi:hypothetical protein
MPNAESDYSNTIFYKIHCKNPDVKDVYIGHTTNFVQRKHAHKYSCIYDKCSNYKCKVYNVIRENGGWDNWNMEIIAFHACEDHYAARKFEQQYFEQYNATLNSIEPLPKPKTIPPPDNPVKIENLCQQTHPNNVAKFSCTTCVYHTDNKKDYNKHLMTSKHKNRTNITEQSSPKPPKPQNPLKLSKPPKSYNCNCGKKFGARNSLWYHKQKCIKQPIADVITTTDVPQITLDSHSVIKILKQNDEFKTIMVEQYAQLHAANKQNIELQRLLVDRLTKT